MCGVDDDDDWQDFETVLCPGLQHCVVTMPLMLMIHIRAVSPLPFLALIRAVCYFSFLPVLGQLPFMTDR